MDEYRSASGDPLPVSEAIERWRMLYNQCSEDFGAIRIELSDAQASINTLWNLLSRAQAALLKWPASDSELHQDALALAVMIEIFQNSGHDIGSGK